MIRWCWCYCRRAGVLVCIALQRFPPHRLMRHPQHASRVLADGMCRLQATGTTGPVVGGLQATHAWGTDMAMSCIAAALEAAVARVRGHCCVSLCSGRVPRLLYTHHNAHLCICTPMYLLSTAWSTTQVPAAAPKHAARVLTTPPSPPTVDHDVLETVLTLTMQPTCQHVASLAAGSTQPRKKHAKAPRPRLGAETPPQAADPPTGLSKTARDLHVTASMHAVAALMLAQALLAALHHALASAPEEAAPGGDAPGNDARGDADSADGSEQGNQGLGGGMRKRGSRVTLTSHLPARAPPIMPVGCHQ